ncbi:MAG: hypothetical protein ACJAR2_000714 [Ilumatobacter sp.]|jgi:hypothetical protein
MFGKWQAESERENLNGRLALAGGISTDPGERMLSRG